MSLRSRLVVVLLLVGAFFFSACSGGGGSPTAPSTNTSTTPSPSPATTVQSMVTIDQVLEPNPAALTYGSTVSAVISWQFSDADWAAAKAANGGNGIMAIKMCVGPDADHIITSCPTVPVRTQSGSQIVSGIPLKNEIPMSWVKATSFGHVFAMVKVSDFISVNQNLNAIDYISYPIERTTYLAKASREWSATWSQ